jgi:hypothetical protein
VGVCDGTSQCVGETKQGSLRGGGRVESEIEDVFIDSDYITLCLVDEKTQHPTLADKAPPKRNACQARVSLGPQLSRLHRAVDLVR